MDIRLSGVGSVAIEELEARFSAYVNAGAPEPVLEGTPSEKRAVLELLEQRGDSQMKAVIGNYLRRESPG